MATPHPSTMKGFAALDGLLIAVATGLAYIHQTEGRREVQYQQRTHPAFVPSPWSTSYAKRPTSFPKPLYLANCESSAQKDAAALFPLEKDVFNYIKLNPDHVERTALQDTHALFGTLLGDGFIERYDVYRRLYTTIKDKAVNNESDGDTTTIQKEIVAVDLSIGHRLNGHDKIVHGGIISLLIDEAMGWAAYESLQYHNVNIDTQYRPSNTLLVTANLNIDFRAPFLGGSEAVLRVYLDEEMTAGRKMYFVARLESYDGSVTFAEAKSLFLCVSSEKIERSVKN